MPSGVSGGASSSLQVHSRKGTSYKRGRVCEVALSIEVNGEAHWRSVAAFKISISWMEKWEASSGKSGMNISLPKRQSVEILTENVSLRTPSNEWLSIIT